MLPPTLLQAITQIKIVLVILVLPIAVGFIPMAFSSLFGPPQTHSLTVPPLRILADPGTLAEPSGDPQVETHDSGASKDLGQQELDDKKYLLSAILHDTEVAWNKYFSDRNQGYVEPKMVLFLGYASSECGRVSATAGPVYCLSSDKLFVDLNYLAIWESNQRIIGDASFAIIVMHEVAHHVQKITGITQRINELLSGASEYDRQYFRLAEELQADCIAGFQLSLAEQITPRLEQGDIEEIIRTLDARPGSNSQNKTGGRTILASRVNSKHGALRVEWFKRGFLSKSGIVACDTFGHMKDLYVTPGVLTPKHDEQNEANDSSNDGSEISVSDFRYFTPPAPIALSPKGVQKLSNSSLRGLTELSNHLGMVEKQGSK